MTETQQRFLRAIAQRVPVQHVTEVHLFPPIRQGGVETGVAVVAEDPRRPAPVLASAESPLELVESVASVESTEVTDVIVVVTGEQDSPELAEVVEVEAVEVIEIDDDGQSSPYARDDDDTDE